jgi:hypothetical protein
LFEYADENKFDSLASVFESLHMGETKFDMVGTITKFLRKVKNASNFEKGVNMIVQFRDDVPKKYRGTTDPIINGQLSELLAKKQAQGLTQQADFIKSKLPADKPRP